MNAPLASDANHNPLVDRPVVEATDYLTLSEAGQLAPGRPSANCLWRWCRRGVLSRAGRRIRLEHVRVGGKIFTSRLWLERFGAALAAADSEHFDGVRSAEATGTSMTKPAAARKEHLQTVDDLLKKGGL